MNPNFGATTKDYARYRRGFPDSIFERLAKLGIGIKDQWIVDLGTGSGSLARGFAQRGCQVVGIDHSEAMLEAARDLDRDAGVAVQYRSAKAENTGLADAAFDVVTAGQCWHWFERGRVAEEVKRVLKPGGVIVIAHFDWIPLAGNLVRLTEELIEAHNPDWNLGGGFGIYPR